MADDDLRQWREARELSRRAVAEALGVTERTVLRWESGHGSPRSGDWLLLRERWPEAAAAWEGGR